MSTFAAIVFLFFVPMAGAYVGFDIAFRVTAFRTREIVREEIAALTAAAADRGQDAAA